MLHSAINFALGFFGHPLDGKYQQSITIEAEKVRVNAMLFSFIDSNDPPLS